MKQGINATQGFQDGLGVRHRCLDHLDVRRKIIPRVDIEDPDVSSSLSKDLDKMASDETRTPRDQVRHCNRTPSFREPRGTYRLVCW